MSKQTYSKPSDVVADGGMVLIDGPDGVDVALTPDAARETGVRLMKQADKAQEQSEEPPS